MITITTQEIVQLQFTIRDEDGIELTDALNVTREERASLTADAIRDLQVGRFERHKERLLERPDEVVPVATEEQVLAEISELEEQRAELDEKLATSNAKLAIFTAKVR